MVDMIMAYAVLALIFVIYAIRRLQQCGSAAARSVFHQLRCFIRWDVSSDEMFHQMRCFILEQSRLCKKFSLQMQNSQKKSLRR